MYTEYCKRIENIALLCDLGDSFQIVNHRALRIPNCVRAVQTISRMCEWGACDAVGDTVRFAIDTPRRPRRAANWVKFPRQTRAAVGRLASPITLIHYTVPPNTINKTNTYDFNKLSITAKKGTLFD